MTSRVIIWKMIMTDLTIVPKEAESEEELDHQIPTPVGTVF